MKKAGFLVLIASSLLVMAKRAAGQAQGDSPPVHVRSTFRFALAIPLKRAAHFFGPEGERCWAGSSWNPEFLYPQPGKDIEGAVFTVQHDTHKSVWVNTRFDLDAGRMQYVSFLPDTLVSIVDVQLATVDPSTTEVEVTYSRTALSSTANNKVVELGGSDKTSGPHWQSAIESCLKTQPPS